MQTGPCDPQGDRQTQYKHTAPKYPISSYVYNTSYFCDINHNYTIVSHTALNNVFAQLQMNGYS